MLFGGDGVSSLFFFTFFVFSFLIVFLRMSLLSSLPTISIIFEPVMSLAITDISCEIDWVSGY